MTDATKELLREARDLIDIAEFEQSYGNYERRDSLLARIDAALADDGWISVEDRLPELHTEVLVAFLDGGLPATAQLLNDVDVSWCWPAENNIDGEEQVVTHWRELPALPKEKT